MALPVGHVLDHVPADLAGGQQVLGELQVGQLDAVGADASRIEAVPDRLGHDLRYAVDWNKIAGELGYAPQVPFEEGLAQTVRWYADNRAWWEPLKAGAALR